MSKDLLLMSSSRSPDDTRWLGNGESHIISMLKDRGVGKVTFVPYAGVTLDEKGTPRQNHDQYVARARDRFREMGFALDSVHEGDDDPASIIERAEAIVAGGVIPGCYSI